ncbi:MAG: adenylyl-sulfate reductase subunit alpha [Thiobacillus sp.]
MSRRFGHRVKTVDCDILIIGGGFGGCGAAYEARYWGRDLKIVVAEKAHIDRSGAVAHGLSAINCYMGMQWGENQPEDFVRYARSDLMGLVREDLIFDIARHVDATVHKFDEWGLPIMKNPETGRYLREGKWQIMIHGESYKPIVAEAAKKSAEVINRIMVTHLLMDSARPNRVAGAVGFSVRDGSFYVFRAKALINGAGGASHVFRPRSVGEGMGRTWYAPWSSASAYALLLEAGAKMIQLENRIVLARFKDGYGPVGAWFLLLKTFVTNAYGERFEGSWMDEIRAMVGKYADASPLPTCLRNHALLQEVKAGKGPILMHTQEAIGDSREKEEIGWEDFLDMTIGQAVVWASQNIDPRETPSELITSEPYVMGSHATCSGAWASGPEDLAPPDYQWGYNRMTTVDGLFGAGDTIGGSAHKFSSGSFTEGRIAGKAAVRYVRDLGRDLPRVDGQAVERLRQTVFRPLDTYAIGRNEIVAGSVAPGYITPLHGLQRLEKIMDEYVGGVSMFYVTSAPLLNRGLELLQMLKEDMAQIGADGLHQLQRAWELHHRVVTAEAVARHTLFREETRWPGYYYRAYHPKLVDDDWHVFTASQYDAQSGQWEMGRLPVHHIVS